MKPFPTTPLTFVIDRVGPAGKKSKIRVLGASNIEPGSNEEQKLCHQSERLFKVFGRLSRKPTSSESVQWDFGIEDGGSVLCLAENIAGPIHVGFDEETFEIRRNESGELSLIEFHCTATNADEARTKFRVGVMPFFDWLAYLANCPLFIGPLRTEDPNNDLAIVDFVSPYGKALLDPGASTLCRELAPVYAMYREAKNSESCFYRFLCYHKLLEGLLGALRADVFTRARERGVNLRRPRETVPASQDIPTRFQDYVGTPVKAFFDAVMEPQFRNAVAHFVTDDGAILNMSAPDHIDNYEDVSFVAELCVRVVVENHETLLGQLPEAQRDAFG